MCVRYGDTRTHTHDEHIRRLGKKRAPWAHYTSGECVMQLFFSVVYGFDCSDEIRNMRCLSVHYALIGSHDDSNDFHPLWLGLGPVSTAIRNDHADLAVLDLLGSFNTEGHVGTSSALDLGPLYGYHFFLATYRGIHIEEGDPCTGLLADARHLGDASV